MKRWKLVLVFALAVLAFAIPDPPLQAYCHYYPCFQGGSCEEYCSCLGFSWGLCTQPYPGYCYCFI
jgi:hypothetical protein